MPNPACKYSEKSLSDIPNLIAQEGKNGAFDVKCPACERFFKIDTKPQWTATQYTMPYHKLLGRMYQMSRNEVRLPTQLMINKIDIEYLAQLGNGNKSAGLREVINYHRTVESASKLRE